MAGTGLRPAGLGERRERGLSGRVDLHAMDAGSGLLIPIFATLVSGQDGERCGGR